MTTTRPQRSRTGILLVILLTIVGAFSAVYFLAASGKLPSRSTAPTFDNYLSRATDGDASAQIAVAEMYRTGNGATKDEAQALIWYLKAAESGLPEAQFKAAVMFHEGMGTARDNARSFIWLNKAAASGHAHAEAMLAVSYQFGEGTEKNIDKACRLYAQAAPKAVPRAAVGLGECYLNGSGGLPQNNAEALKWFKAAAERNDPQGMYGLAIMYARGSNTLATSLEAAHWATLSAGMGHKAAQALLSQAHEQCSNVPDERVRFRDYNVFNACVLDAVNGTADAQYVVGLGLYSGNPHSQVPKDQVGSLSWFRKAAEQGHAAAQAFLAKQNASGEPGLPVNINPPNAGAGGDSNSSPPQQGNLR
ncbi:MAG: hypothetical protein ABS36_08800 [Acidobacteria bacterium SCN 69-37]|nr:MAG: hypothetical protein ABS36_08800 [Acidobacteria bacterium SCN 69-37]